MTNEFPPPIPSAPIPVQPQPPASPTKWWSKKLWKLPVWGWILVVLVVLGAIGSITGTKKEERSETKPSQTTAAASETTGDSVAPETTAEPATTSGTAPVTTVAPTTVPPTTVPPTTLPPTTPAPTLPSFGEGVMLVGTDMQPGLYMAVVPSSSFGCYWARLAGLSGELGDIIANDNVSPGAQVVLQIGKGDVAFDSSDCGRWTVYLPPASPATTFGEGTWVVGQQIQPGRYRSTGPGPDDFGCYWERKRGLGGTFNDIIANDNQSGPTIVEIAASDIGFKSSGCGTWSKM